ncbi:hypothetical protein PMIN06_000301 [Paraphaeosphaeria minitans]|uniref:Uncharacterized protein n=1 Tax=Paraphaeosphaeria minitans TaxID=565426 RepID=A0A9P6GRM4_9PLEO|nr:hypothetical protein PMIN01_00116 [Paraphaeosphaeria minitans]
MRVAAPEDMESTSSLSTLLSEVSPPQPTVSQSNEHIRHQRSNRLQSRRRKSTGTVVEAFSGKAEPFPTSMPLPIPRVSVLPPTPEASQTPTTPSKAPQIHILPPTPEARQSLPQLGGARSVNVPPPMPAPPKLLPCPSKGHHLQAPLSEPSQKALEKQTSVESTEATQPLQIHSSLIFQPAPENLLGTYKGPPYQPFGGPNHSVGRKPRLKRHASFIDLRDCWRTPEAELTTRVFRRWSSGNPPSARARRPRSPLAQDGAEEEVEADEQTPLLAGVGATSGEALEDEDDVHVATHRESPTETATEMEMEMEIDTESDTEAASRLETLLSTVLFPLLVFYSYVASAITTYLHDRAAHSGSLGSHDTETARWLRRVDGAFPVAKCTHSQRSYGSFSSPSGSSHQHKHQHKHKRTGSRGSLGSLPTLSPHSRKTSRGSLAPEEARGVFEVVRWGDGIGDGYGYGFDPC